jgi:nucleotidyltransferase/DNA polymerase involved in DNA repair
LRFRTVTVKVRNQEYVTRTKAHSLSHYTDDCWVIRSSAHSLFSELLPDMKVRLIGIRLSSFEKQDASQTTLTT